MDYVCHKQEMFHKKTAFRDSAMMYQMTNEKTVHTSNITQYAVALSSNEKLPINRNNPCGQNFTCSLTVYKSLHVVYT